jgi:hypothetical protein
MISKPKMLTMVSLATFIIYKGHSPSIVKNLIGNGSYYLSWNKYLKHFQDRVKLNYHFFLKHFLLALLHLFTLILFILK